MYVYMTIACNAISPCADSAMQTPTNYGKLERNKA